MLGAEKFHSLDLEFSANERKEIGACDDHVATEDPSRFVVDAKVRTKFFENFCREKGDLAFVVFAEIEVTVAPQTATGHAFHLRNLNERKVARRLTVVADKVVAGRDEDLPDEHAMKAALIRREIGFPV